MTATIGRQLAVSAAMLGCLGACSSSRFGEVLLTSAPGAGESAALREITLPASFPGSGTFNLHNAQRFSSGGASAEANVDRAGAARATVSLHETGEGWAEFELGQVIPAGATSSALPVIAAVKLDSEYELTAKDASNPSPSGKLTLKVVILDSQRRVVKRQTLTEVELGQAAPRGSGRFERTFEFSLEPSLSYQILVAGRVELGSPTAAADASSSLSVSRVEVTLQSAAPNRSAAPDR